MKNIIRFPMANVEYSENVFDWLIDRLKEYLDFLKKCAPKKDKSEWSKKFIVVLKFLGDYQLEDELKEFERNEDKNG